MWGTEVHLQDAQQKYTVIKAKLKVHCKMAKLFLAVLASCLAASAIAQSCHEGPSEYFFLFISWHKIHLS